MWRNGGTSNLFLFLLLLGVVTLVASAPLFEVVLWYLFLLEVVFNSGLAGRAGLELLLLTRDLLVLAGEAVRGLVLDCKLFKSFFFEEDAGAC